MSLHKPAAGILQTHVTWEDIESDLQKKFGTKATFGKNKKATNISDLKGFLSIIACVEPDWQNVEIGKELPMKFAVKIASQLPLIPLTKLLNFENGQGFSEEKLKKLQVYTRKFHNIEVNVYKRLAEFNHPDIPYTKVYSLKRFEDDNDLKGYMIVEFVSNVHQVEMHQSIPADDLLPIVRGISTFSALTQSLAPEETGFALGTDFLEVIFHEFYSDEELTKKIDQLRTTFSKEPQETVEKMIEVLHHYKALVKKYTTISESLGLKLVLNHGDLWQSNVLFSLEEDGKLKLEALIDWQTVTKMPPGLDLSRLLLGCLTPEDRRSRGTEFLKCYHETFTKVNGKELFTFHELQVSYNLLAPMMAMAIITEMQGCVDNAEISGEELVVVRKQVTEKMTAMMEDVLDIHEYNLKHFPDFMRI